MLSDMLVFMGGYILWMASLHRLIGNFPAVNLRRKSVTEIAYCGSRTFWRTPMYPRHRIHVETSGIWGPNFPNSQLSGKYSLCGPPCCQKRWWPGDKILPGSGAPPSTSRKPPNCTSTPQIGYWDGRFRGPNFLATPTVPPALESMSKGCDSGAEIPEFPTFWEISTWRTPMFPDTLAPRRQDNVWPGNLSVDLSPTSPLLHIRPKSVTEMVNFGPRAFWRPPTVLLALGPMSKRVRFGARTSQSSNFLGNIDLADPMLSDTSAPRSKYIVWKRRPSVD